MRSLEETYAALPDRHALFAATGRANARPVCGSSAHFCWTGRPKQQLTVLLWMHLGPLERWPTHRSLSNSSCEQLQKNHQTSPKPRFDLFTSSRFAPPSLSAFLPPNRPVREARAGRRPGGLGLQRAARGREWRPLEPSAT